MFHPEKLCSGKVGAAARQSRIYYLSSGAARRVNANHISCVGLIQVWQRENEGIVRSRQSKLTS